MLSRYYFSEKCVIVRISMAAYRVPGSPSVNHEKYERIMCDSDSIQLQQISIDFSCSLLQMTDN